MTTDELNAIVQAVMLEMEKAGVDFDFKAETPQPTDLVYVMRGTADKYQGITVKWQNLLDIIVQKATEAKNEAVSAKDIALQTLATIQSIESNISTMKTSVETTKGEVETLKNDVSTMKASVETSEANVTQMKASVEAAKSDVEGMKTSVEATKTEVEGLLDTKANVTYVDGELAKKVNYSDALSYEEIMASTDLTNKVASASSLKHLKPITGYKSMSFTTSTTLSYIEGAYITIPANCIFGIDAKIEYFNARPLSLMISLSNSGNLPDIVSFTEPSINSGSIDCSFSSYTKQETTYYVWGKYNLSNMNNVYLCYWYIKL